MGLSKRPRLSFEQVDTSTMGWSRHWTFCASDIKVDGKHVCLETLLWLFSLLRAGVLYMLLWLPCFWENWDRIEICAFLQMEMRVFLWQSFLGCQEGFWFSLNMKLLIDFNSSIAFLKEVLKGYVFNFILYILHLKSFLLGLQSENQSKSLDLAKLYLTRSWEWLWFSWL